MPWQMTLSQTSAKGQKVEYWQCPGGGYSMAESPARVKVSGRVVAKGWSCDGVTYAEYDRIVQEGYIEPTPEHTCGPGIQYGCDVPDCDGDTD